MNFLGFLVCMVYIQVNTRLPQEQEIWEHRRSWAVCAHTRLHCSLMQTETTRPDAQTSLRLCTLQLWASALATRPG